MKIIALSVSTLVLVSCGGKSKSSTPTAQEEESIGIMKTSDCRRAKEVRGTNALYHWTKAEKGDLQRILLDMELKNLKYDEATENDFYHGAASFIQRNATLYFKSMSKSLKFNFQAMKLGMIENDLTAKEYKVGILSYDDGSGYQIPFLCTQDQ